jgi:hypothetical protein
MPEKAENPVSAGFPEISDELKIEYYQSEDSTETLPPVKQLKPFPPGILLDRWLEKKIAKGRGGSQQEVEYLAVTLLLGLEVIQGEIPPPWPLVKDLLDYYLEFVRASGFDCEQAIAFWNQVRLNPQAYREYDKGRNLKEIKEAIERFQGGQDDDGDRIQEKGKRSIPDQLIDLATASEVTLWHTPDGEAYVDILENGIRQTLPLRRKAFRQWLSRRYYLKEGKSPSTDALQQAINTLEALAVYDGLERAIYLRVAEFESRIYIDLGTPDWKSVEVSADGWKSVSEAPVRFRRENQHPLPIPESGGNLDELQQLLSLESDSWLLFLTYTLNCLKPQSSYPILILHGEAGAGKSTKARVIRRLTDSNNTELLSVRNLADPRNLAISATKRRVLAFDNLSGLSAEQSDDLCRIATGGSFTHRILHSDSDEITFSFANPVILTGIDTIATRGDLLDRAILLPLKTPSIRKEEEEFWAEFDLIHAKTFGALLNLLSKVLAILPSVKLPANAPRMAGFAKLGIAVEQALELPEGTFLAAYQGVRESAHETAIEASPIAQAVIDLMNDRTCFTGTASELLAELNNRVQESVRKSKYWVSDATRLSGQLTRLAPNLRGVGIDYSTDRAGKKGTRLITLEKIGILPSAPSAIAKPLQIEGSKADARLTLETLADASGSEEADANDSWLTLENSASQLASAFETFSQKEFEGLADAADAADASFPTYSEIPLEELGIDPDQLEEWYDS